MKNIDVRNFYSIGLLTIAFSLSGFYTYAQDECLMAIEDPIIQAQQNTTYGQWMTDPKQTLGEGKIFVMPAYYGSYVNEYSSLSDLKNNIISAVYTLPVQYAGTGAVVYDGYLYYNRRNSNKIIKYDLKNQLVEGELSIPNAGSMNTYHYQWGGWSDIDLAIDESGLWVLYSTFQNSGKLVVSKLDDNNFSISQTWYTSSEMRNQMGNAFIVCGVVYSTDTYYGSTTTINYKFNTSTATGSSVSIPFNQSIDEFSTYQTQIDYNPREKMLYSWNNTRLVTQKVVTNQLTDTTPPQLIGIPEDVEVACNKIPEITLVTAEDNEDGFVEVSFSEERVDGECINSFTLIRTWSATDAAGNVTSASQNIVVSDKVGPEFNELPGQVIAVAAENKCSAMVSFPAISATDNCGNVTLSYSHNSETEFPVGETIVSVTASDECGNTTTSSFTILVLDEQAPELTVPADITVANDPDICGAVVEFTAPSAIDNCAGVTVEKTDDTGLSSGSEFPVGTTTLSYVATDAAGNISSTNFTVTVTNQVPEVISVSVRENPVLANSSINVNGNFVDSNLSTAVWSWVDGTTSEGIISGEQISGRHSYRAAGFYNLSLTVTDACGESSTYRYEDYIAVYDPNAGFITGGGWFMSPIGSLVGSSGSNKAFVEFNAKYHKHSTSPQGKFKLTVKEGAEEGKKGNGKNDLFQFTADSFDWLIIDNHKAYLSGSGKINKNSGATFILSIIDGKQQGEKNDYIRVQVKDGNGDIIYENQWDAMLPDEPIQLLDKGSLVIHKTEKDDKHIRNNSRIVANQLKFYPNPAVESITLDFSDFTAEKASYYVVNLWGTIKVADEIKIKHNSQIEIDVRQLDRGIHVIVVETSDEKQMYRFFKN